jgi:hypothetical protein
MTAACYGWNVTKWGYVGFNLIFGGKKKKKRAQLRNKKNITTTF